MISLIAQSRYPLSNPVYRAAATNDYREFRRLTCGGIDQNVLNCENQTLLIVATMANSLPIVRRLLRRPVNLNLRDNFEKCALHYAVEVDASTIIKALLRAGADPNVVDKDNKTPLRYAVQYSSLKIVRTLLDYSNVDTELKDVTGLTPLLYCALFGHFAKAELLVDRHASKEVCDKEAQTPLHLAARRGHLTLTRLLLSPAAEGARDKQGRTPLMVAMMYDRILIVEMLLLRCLDLTIKDELGMNFIHYATIMNSPSTVEHMLAVTGLSIDDLDLRGLTPLQLAIRITSDEVIDILLHFGANLNVQSLHGTTPLMEAVYRNSAGIVSKLVHYLS